MMKNRRNFLALVTAFLPFFRAKASPPNRPPVKELARRELTGPQAGLEAILVEVTAAGGSPSTVHRRPGFVLGYVLKGEMKFAINSEAPQVIDTGATFYEPFGALHTVGTSANPNAPVRFLAFIVAPKGSPVTLPA